MHWLAEAVQFDAAERALLLTSPHGAASALIESGDLAHGAGGTTSHFIDVSPAEVLVFNARGGPTPTNWVPITRRWT